MINTSHLLGTEIETQLLKENKRLRFGNSVLWIIAIIFAMSTLILLVRDISRHSEYVELSKSFARISELNANLAEKLNKSEQSRNKR